MRGWMAVLVLCLGGCEVEPEVAQRGLGLADGVVGSCADACGEATAEGNCWCDEACAEHGDCCEDKVEVCGGEGPDPLVPVLCEEVDDCPSGMTCDQSACYSGCREGDDCEDACMGMCVEPTQQSLPTPTGTDVPGGGGDGDDDGGRDGGGAEDDAEVPVCDCPEGDLCVPLCPVCPPEVPDEECQCSVVCVSL
ncbi:MAG: hypothetical protein ACE37F_23105 [Nannocystaceae bacterium]|nr:hypothetical protein [bacterium]